MKIKFETLEELQKTFPIGTRLAEEFHYVTEERFWYRHEDLGYYRNCYEDVTVISDHECLCRRKEYFYEVVDGYLFDGEYWYPARNTWDGWLPFTESDLKKKED
jgi:hypothetical protein